MTSDRSADVRVRLATSEDRLAVRRLLDAAVLAVEDLSERLAAGEVLVATDDGSACGVLVAATDGPPAGDGGRDALPAEWRRATHVRAVAVRRRRRDAGIGTALVRAATARFGPLVADFDAELRPFYESLGAEYRPAADERWWALVPEGD